MRLAEWIIHDSPNLVLILFRTIFAKLWSIWDNSYREQSIFGRRSDIKSFLKHSATAVFFCKTCKRIFAKSRRHSNLVSFCAKIQKEKNFVCHQWSTRPDPQSRQLWSLFSLVNCLVSGDFEKWGRTDVQTLRMKILITTSRDCGSASWIKRNFVNGQKWTSAPIIKSTGIVC